jgi:nucleoside-diphosphate-sugar epimerase
MESNFTGPVNIGSEEMITINGLAEMAMDIAKKKLSIRHISGPLGVRGRNSDNALIKEKLKWAPSSTLRQGMELVYLWVEKQVKQAGTKKSSSVQQKAA